MRINVPLVVTQQSVNSLARHKVQIEIVVTQAIPEPKGLGVEVGVAAPSR